MYKRRKFRLRNYRNTIKGINREVFNTNSGSINLKDFIIPLFTAVTVLFFNQLVFEANRKTEALIQYQKEILREQRPMLNRILAFTYKYEYAIVSTGYKDSFSLDIKQLLLNNKGLSMDNNEDILNFMKEFNYDSFYKIRNKNFELKNDTLLSFFIDEKKRMKLKEDLDYLYLNRDLINHSIYIAIEDIIDFVGFDDDGQINVDLKLSSTETIKKWESLLFRLRENCQEELNQFLIN